MRFGIGQPVARKEDPRFLTGRGRFVADIELVREAHAVLVYSPHAHARLRSIDKSAAEEMPGVLAVLTGEDWAADGLGALEAEPVADDRGVPLGFRSKRPPWRKAVCAMSGSASPSLSPQARRKRATQPSGSCSIASPCPR